MIIDSDLSAIEWRTAAELSKDIVMISEIVNGLDPHLQNAIDYFGDASFRQTAKVFGFRMIYGGSAYAFHMDANMPKLGLPRWEEIVEAFYLKYKGLHRWQEDNYKFVCTHGYYTTFTGRHYKFNKVKRKDGTLEYSWPSVCNYACQGTATADVVSLVLIKLMKIYKDVSPDIKLINQVHDSIVIDAPSRYLEVIAENALSTFEAIPQLIKDHYGYDWETPMGGEVSFGENWSDMKKYQRRANG